MSIDHGCEMGTWGGLRVHAKSLFTRQHRVRHNWHLSGETDHAIYGERHRPSAETPRKRRATRWAQIVRIDILLMPSETVAALHYDHRVKSHFRLNQAKDDYVTPIG